MGETIVPAAVAGGQSDTDVNLAWQEDNQAWWDWYVSLAADDGAPITEFAPVPPLPDIARPSLDELTVELQTPYPLTEDEIEAFQRDSFIKLPDVLSPGAVMAMRDALLAMLSKAFGASLDGGVSDRFLSLEMMWQTDETIRAFVLSPRIAGICGRLLGADGIRLYHDNALSKEPGCGRTPWHYDDHHFPLATQNVVTAWIPAQPIPLAMGPLAFAAPMAAYKLIENLEFNKKDTSYDRTVAEIFAKNAIAVNETPFAMGEVSFHHNNNFHTAGRNRTTQSRIVLANTYYEDGARIVDSPTMVSGDWQKFMPGIGPGDVAASPLNPICWRRP
ncbi:MAG: phytanoyl-CoA dioxygenase family protein [Pseudomonadota bacterium]